MLGNRRILVVDETQHIEGIGMALKLVVDELPEIQVIATGSFSFELRNRPAELLAGRKFEYRRPPLSFGELVAAQGLLEAAQERERRLLYGGCPDVVSHPGEEQGRLAELTENHLLKDIYAMDGVKKVSCLDRLVRAFAFQNGSVVNRSGVGEHFGDGREDRGNENSRAKIPSSFRNACPEAATATLTPKNYDSLLLWMAG